MLRLEHLSCALKCKQMYKKNKPVHFYKKQNTMAFVGTRNVFEFSHSLNAFKTDDQIHTGYKKYAQKCMRIIQSDILKDVDPNKKLTLTAHSLGSVAATIIASKLIHYDIELVIFGTPKPGGTLFKREFDKLDHITTYNYVTRHDPVQYYPFLDYEHVGEILYLENVKYRNIMSNHTLDCYIENLSIQ